MSRKVIVINLIFLGVGICVGLLITQFKSTTPSSVEEVRLKKQYKFINPLLECSTSIGGYLYPKAMRTSVERYLNAQILDNKVTLAAVYYRDLNNGPWFGINERVMFSPASLIKVPLMMAYFKKAEENPNLLGQKITYVKVPADLVNEPYIIPKVRLEDGKEYSVEELIEHMIIYSDNSAYRVLKEALGRETFNEIFSDFGIDITAIENSKDENVLSILAYSSFFRILYNSSYLGREYSEKALDLLSRVEYKEGIVGGVPEATIVSHKFGERFYKQSSEKQLHDCGIVYKSSKPYLICIMTRGNDFERLSQVIKEVSNIVFKETEN